MKNLSKPIFAVILVISLFISTSVATFAGHDSDPGGSCMFIGGDVSYTLDDYSSTDTNITLTKYDLIR